MSFGVDPRNPLEYARINYFLIPGVSYNREPISGVGGDYDFQIETIWRVGNAPNGNPPTTGAVGDQWILTTKTGSYAQGTQNPTWQKFIPGGSPSLFTLSDTTSTVVQPSGSGATPPNDIRLYSSDATVTIVSDPTNNRMDFTVDGGQAVNEFTTDVGGPVFDNAGVVNFTGATSTYTNGSVTNTLRTEVQGTNHALFVGRGSQTPAANIGVGTNGQVLLGATGANPAFGTLTSSNGSIGFTQGVNSLSLQTTGNSSTAICFQATLSASTVSGVTGAGTEYTIPFNTATINQGSGFNTGTGVFTAPQSGNYIFTYTLCLENLTALMTTMKAHIKTIAIAGPTTTYWRICEGNVAAEQATSGNSYTASGSVIVFMNVNDTAVCNVTISGGAGNTANIQGGSLTTFCGYLLC